MSNQEQKLRINKVSFKNHNFFKYEGEGNLYYRTDGILMLVMLDKIEYKIFSS